jgi:DNA polymerase III delta prime subunit
MIGQKKLLEKFNNVDNIPKATILLGRTGSGKHTFINAVVNKLGISEVITINSILSPEIKDKIYTYPNLCVIIFNVGKELQVKQNIAIQNSILKLLEEPPINARIFVLAENESYLLDTLLNRCNILTLEPYTADELRQIAKENNFVTTLDEHTDDKLKYISSPAELLVFPTNEKLTQMEKLVDTIFSSICKANISNTLSISKKINFNDDRELYDLNIFLNIFEIKLLDIIKYNYEDKYLVAYNELNELKSNINRFNINKTNLFEKFLLNLKTILV